MEQAPPIGGAGDHLRSWRRRRRLSQLDCALAASISQRHLSFLESGRARPSREMLLHLAERLEIPLRERNAALLAAGFAPVYAERSLDDPAMAAASAAIDLILRAHQPFPALVVDLRWHLLRANAALAPLLSGVADKRLLEPPVNVLRLSLHPGGLAPRILNLPEWRDHLLERLRRQASATRDAGLIALLRELTAYPAGGAAPSGRAARQDHGGVLVPLRLQTDQGALSLISTTTVFGTPRDIHLAEIAIEAFFPADTGTRRILDGLRPGEPGAGGD
jgi:transcriptional regulator with XRE-family HTH domain